MNKQHKDETVPAAQGWYVAYAVRVTMASNAEEITKLRDLLASDEASETAGVVLESLRGALAHAEELRCELFDAYAKLPEDLRPDPQRYPREVARCSVSTDGVACTRSAAEHSKLCKHHAALTRHDG